MAGVINLSKGQRVNLTKEAPGLRKIMVGLGWDINTRIGMANNRYSNYEYDLDASAFLIGDNGKTKPEGFVFYNNLIGPNECVKHMGDNRTGAGDGDDEQIYIDLDRVPADISKIAITITIDDAVKKEQNFGQIDNCFCRIVNDETDEEMFRYDLRDNFSIETAVVICEFYKHNGVWKFTAVGSGFSGGLLALCNNYGLDAEYK